MGVLSDLPGVIAEALGDVLSAAEFLKAAGRTPDGRGGFMPSAVISYPCRGIVSDYSQFKRSMSGGVIAENDREIIIAAKTLAPTPAVGDSVRINGATFRVEDVSSDPARATWTLRGRITTAATDDSGALVLTDDDGVTILGDGP